MKSERVLTEIEEKIKNMTFSLLSSDEEVVELEKLVQVIPAEMMQELKNAAETKGVGIDLEVVARLLATIIEPYAFGFNPELEIIIKKKTQQKQIKLEQLYRERAWGIVYELDKLRLLITLENKLPKETIIKELASFKLINVKKESEKIKAEILEEKKNNNE